MSSVRWSTAGGMRSTALPRTRWPCDPGRPRHGRRRCRAENLLYRVEHRVRARTARRRRVVAGARRYERHWHHRDPARQGLRGKGGCHRRLRCKVQGVPRARRRCGNKLPARGLRGRRQGADAGTRRRCHPRHGRRRLYRTQHHRRRRGRPDRADRHARRRRGAMQPLPRHDQAADDYRIDAAAAHPRGQGRLRARTGGQGVAAAC
jgi:hypothetical protein